MDALCQLVEPFISNAANPFVDALAREGIMRASRSLRDACRGPTSSLAAREDMAIASVLGGISLANAKLGTVHGFAGVLGGMYANAAHGAICARLLPIVFEKNAAALSAAASDEAADDVARSRSAVRLNRLREVSKMVTGNPNASVREGVEWMNALLSDLQIPKLSAVCAGISEADFAVIVSATMEASSTKGNPVVLSAQALREVLADAM